MLGGLLHSIGSAVGLTSSSSSGAAQQQQQQQQPSKAVSGGEVKAQAAVDLFKWSWTHKRFLIVAANVKLSVVRCVDPRYQWFLQMQRDEDLAAGTAVVAPFLVNAGMQMENDVDNKALVWITLGAKDAMTGSAVHRWSVVFKDVAEHRAVVGLVPVALYEHGRQVDFAKSVKKEDDQQWVANSISTIVRSPDRKNAASRAAALDDDDSDGNDGAGEEDFVFMDTGEDDDEYSDDDSGEGTDDQGDDTKHTSTTTTASTRATRARVSTNTNYANSWSSDDEDKDEDDEGGIVYESATPAPTPQKPAVERNSDILSGMTSNRAFVIRGDKVGVFKYDDDDQLVYDNTRLKVRSMQGNFFSPHKATLHNQDSKMLMVRRPDDGIIHCMDVERGQVVSEFQAGDDDTKRKVNDFTALSKYAPAHAGEPMTVAVSNNELYTLDPRQHTKDKIAQRYVYSKNPYFTKVVTTADGGVATGSDDGTIRMFSAANGKMAKTLLPGLGDPIIGLDVSGDGRWILATCRTYLLVIPTQFEDKKNRVRTGFDARMGQNKPVPRKLQLHTTDLAKHGITKVSFTPASFNVGEDTDEKWIVTGTGKYIVLWNFAKVQQGQLYDYRIKSCSASVVADNFRYNKDDQLQVALPDDVTQERLVRGRAVHPMLDAQYEEYS